VTSPATAKLVASDYGVPAERITVARPGSDPAPRSSGSRNEVPHLLSVGAVVPRKGFEVLVAALATLADLPWRLTIAGDLARDPNDAYGHLINELIYNVTYDVRSTWVDQ